MAALRLTMLAVAGLVIAQFDDWPAVTTISICILVVLAVTFIWTRVSLRGISFGRRLSSDRVQVGDELREAVVLENRSALPKIFVEIQDRSTLPGHSASRVINLNANTSREWTATSIAHTRGHHRLGPVTVRSGDPLGLFRRDKRLIGALDVTIYPMTVPLSKYTPTSAFQSGGGIIQRRSTVPTPTVGGIRDYVPGDSINRISWTATARAGRLMVKEFETDPTADLWVVLDLYAEADRRQAPSAWDLASDNPMLWLGNDFEYRVMLSGSLVRRTLSLGRSVGLIINSEQPYILPPERSDGQYVRILEILASVEPIDRRSISEVMIGLLPRFRRDSAVVVVTSHPDATMATLLAQLKRRRVFPEIVIVEERMETEEIRVDLVRQSIPSYRLTRVDNPSVALNSAMLAPFGLGA